MADCAGEREWRIKGCCKLGRGEGGAFVSHDDMGAGGVEAGLR